MDGHPTVHFQPDSGQPEISWQSGTRPLDFCPILCDDNNMKNLNAYTILENVVRELDALYDREDDKHPMDSDFVTGHLDDLDEIISQLRELTEFDPTP